MTGEERIVDLRTHIANQQNRARDEGRIELSNWELAESATESLGRKVTPEEVQRVRYPQREEAATP